MLLRTAHRVPITTPPHNPRPLACTFNSSRTSASPASSSTAVLTTPDRGGLQVVIQPPAINLTALRTATARAAYADATVAAVRAAYVDGVTFDYESPVSAGSVDA